MLKQDTILGDIQVMDNFIVGNETHSIKDYFLHLKVDNMRLFIAAYQGGGEMSDNFMAILLLKAKVAARKWMYTVCGWEVNTKYKREHTTSFALPDSPNKKECPEDLENVLIKVIEDPCLHVAVNMIFHHEHIRA